jgi:hypothetical protein
MYLMKEEKRAQVNGCDKKESDRLTKTKHIGICIFEKRKAGRTA